MIVSTVLSGHSIFFIDSSNGYDFHQDYGLRTPLIEISDKILGTGS